MLLGYFYIKIFGIKYKLIEGSPFGNTLFHY